MKVNVEKNEKNIVTLEIEVPVEEFNEAVEISYKNNMKKYAVPGFRKGKAPRKVLERYYGEEIFYEDAMEVVFSKTYEVAIEENSIEPVDRPDVDIKQIGKGQSLIYTAKVTVKPEITLGDYKEIEIEKIEVDVNDEDVDKKLKEMQEKNAREVEVTEDPTKDGDSVNINFEGFVDGEAFEGGKAENHDLTIGSGNFIPGFEEQLVGKKIDEEIEVNVQFPEEYHSKDLAGKDALFKVTINSIRTKELPELDDEFVKDISEYDTLEDYKKVIRQDLEKQSEEEVKRQKEVKILEKIIEKSEFEVPEVMIENRLNSIVYEFESSLKMQGIDLKTYLQILKTDLPSFKNNFKDRAKKEVENSLIIEKIIEVENVKPSEEEIEAEINEAAQEMDKEPAEFKKSLNDDDMERIQYNVTVKNTLDMLFKNTKFVS